MVDLFFQLYLFRDEKKILNACKKNYKKIKEIKTKIFPMPKSMLKNMKVLIKLKKKGVISFQERFGIIVFKTTVYSLTK